MLSTTFMVLIHEPKQHTGYDNIIEVMFVI
jgi:hypothetical protein